MQKIDRSNYIFWKWNKSVRPNSSQSKYVAISMCLMNQFFQVGISFKIILFSHTDLELLPWLQWSVDKLASICVTQNYCPLSYVLGWLSIFIVEFFTGICIAHWTINFPLTYLIVQLLNLLKIKGHTNSLTFSLKILF